MKSDVDRFYNLLNEIKMTKEDRKYFYKILSSLKKEYLIAVEARRKKLDPTDMPESLLAWDMAERVEKLVGPPGIVDFIRKNESSVSRERLALDAVDAILKGEFGIFPVEKAADQAIRTALAILTEGVTVAPTQGIYKVCIRRNPYPYLSIYFAGPIRSAGGTEAGLTLIYADYVRRKLGLMRYRPIISESENEVNRFIEEIRVYEREVGRFQFHIPDSLIEYTVTRLPIELNGIPTTTAEVTLNRNMSRIETNRLRGGALIVLNDGLIARARKILNIISELKINGWEWLSEVYLKEDRAAVKEGVVFDVIGGRPVVSPPNETSGFRLRYGRAANTGLSAIGIHPAAFAILNYIIVPGTQVKINYPGKAAIVMPVKSISPPIVKLKNGSVVKVTSEAEALKIKDEISRVLWLGDALISVGDFLENNSVLHPSAYVEEWWIADLKSRILDKSNYLERRGVSVRRQIEIANGIVPTFKEALTLSKILKIPLHPRYTLRWTQISKEDLQLLITYLREKIDLKERSIPFNSKISSILDKLLATYVVSDGKIFLTGEASSIFCALSQTKAPINDEKGLLEIISDLFDDIQIRDVTGSFIAARMGRPEKASRREMSPPVHVLFPIKAYGGSTRNIVSAAESKGTVSVELSYRRCKSCGELVYTAYCQKCYSETERLYFCKNCKLTIKDATCPNCGQRANPFKEFQIDFRSLLSKCRAKFKAYPKLVKGVRGLTNAEKIPENLEKGFLRAVYGLSVFKDGTIRFDVTNAPLTHFRPKDINLTVEKARELGYKVDSTDDLISLKVQDVIIPRKAADYLITVSLFVDRLLKEVYGLKSYYNAKSHEDLIGKLIVGLSPHTSVGVIGRIIGFTNAQVVYAHPFWHATKRRDCDGDQDSIMLLMDVLVNFSRYYLPATIGGEMDTPLLLSPIIIPSEVDSQAHKMEVVNRLPLELYKASLRRENPKKIMKHLKWVANFLNTDQQYSELPFCSSGYKLHLKTNITSYSRLKTMYDKITHQINISDLISPNLTSVIVKSVIEHHLLPDLIGNLKAYMNRGYICRKCGIEYRRPPLFRRCEKCGRRLIPTVREKSVVKYLVTIKQLINKYCVGERYLTQRVDLLERELKELMGTPSQRKLIDFI